MRFEWSDEKNQQNLRKHGVSFETAKQVFDDPALSVRERVVDGEERWQTMGLIDSVVVLLVAHTYREEDDAEIVRVISARKATRNERKAYDKNYKESIEGNRKT